VNSTLPIATLLLAAGSSSRLGHPKQLLPFHGTTLLRHAAQTALEADLGPVFVVLGSRESDCRDALSGLPLSVVVNWNWEEGLGTSIAAGMAGIDESSFRAVLLTLCDQPFVTASDLRALTDALPGHDIAASDLGDTVGSPAIFAVACFPRLRSLRGPQGAKTLFTEFSSLATVQCPRALVDVDTKADAARLLDRAP
jgi:molybdenum cofactor cytidylyltransferase